MPASRVSGYKKGGGVSTLKFDNGEVSVGDVFASSWGYEQTNVSFYQVVSVHGKKTVMVREIRGVANFTYDMGDIKN